MRRKTNQKLKKSAKKTKQIKSDVQHLDTNDGVQLVALQTMKRSLKRR